MEKTFLPIQEHIAEFKSLLDKFRLQTHLVEMRGGNRQDLEQVLIERQRDAELERRLKSFHVADLAQLLEALPLEDRHLIWSHIASHKRGDILLELSDAVLDYMLQTLSREELITALSELDADELGYLRSDIPEDIFQEIISSLSAADRSWIKNTDTYKLGTVGHLMTGEIVKIRSSLSVANCHNMLRNLGKLPPHTDKLFVIDARGHLVGTVFLEDILINDLEMEVGQIMKTNVVTFQPEDDLDEASMAFDRYDLVSVPVINERGKPIGRLTVDMMMEYTRDESETDALNVAGVIDTEDLYSTIWDSARNRWLWLSINLVTAFINSRIIGLFEPTISQIVALASLMPIIASVAGNTGNQTGALVIRSLALNQLSKMNFWYLLRKELVIALLNGFVWGGIIGLFAFIFYQQWPLALVVSAAMISNFFLAALAGVTAPFLLDRLGRDPAMGSSVLLTGLTDGLGFFVFLLLASIFLI